MIRFFENHERNKTCNINKIYRTTDDLTETQTYTKGTNHDLKLIEHQGQIKLLLSELEFFAVIDLVSLAPCTVIYAGCSPFTHGFSLVSFYDNIDINWIIIDPRNLNPIYKLPKKATFMKKYVTKELCEELRESIKGSIIFISDIRLSEGGMVKAIDIQRDQNLNNICMDILKPIHSLLKFRYTFPDDHLPIIVPYPHTIYLQAFSKLNSAETRMHVESNFNYRESTLEDSILHEEKISFYSCNIKRCKVVNPKLLNLIKKYRWNCCCYDCVLMFDIMEKFVKVNKIKKHMRDVINYFFSFTKVRMPSKTKNYDD